MHTIPADSMNTIVSQVSATNEATLQGNASDQVKLPEARTAAVLAPTQDLTPIPILASATRARQRRRPMRHNFVGGMSPTWSDERYTEDTLPDNITDAERKDFQHFYLGVPEEFYSRTGLPPVTPKDFEQFFATHSGLNMAFPRTLQRLWATFSDDTQGQTPHWLPSRLSVRLESEGFHTSGHD